MTKQTTFYVHAILGDLFEDLYVKASTKVEAIAKARALLKGSAMDSRWTNFVV